MLEGLKMENLKREAERATQEMQLCESAYDRVREVVQKELDPSKKELDAHRAADWQCGGSQKGEREAGNVPSQRSGDP